MTPEQPSLANRLRADAFSLDGVDEVMRRDLLEAADALASETAARVKAEESKIELAEHLDKTVDLAAKEVQRANSAEARALAAEEALAALEAARKEVLELSQRWPIVAADCAGIHSTLFVAIARLKAAGNLRPHDLQRHQAGEDAEQIVDLWIKKFFDTSAFVSDWRAALVEAIDDALRAAVRERDEARADANHNSGVAREIGISRFEAEAELATLRSARDRAVAVLNNAEYALTSLDRAVGVALSILSSPGTGGTGGEPERLADIAGEMLATDTDLINWLEVAAKRSLTGISFDWVPSVEGEPSGFRFMRRGSIGEAKKTIRATILAAKVAGVTAAFTASPMAEEAKPCTCHPDDNPPRPCPRKYALSECRKAASFMTEARRALEISLRQWRMYAEMEEPRDLAMDTDAEAVSYQSCRAALANLPDQIGDSG